MQLTAGGHGLYLWGPLTFEAEPASNRFEWERGEELSWPVIWLTGSHHYKHRWQTHSQISMKKVFDAVDNWSSKLRWRVALSGNEGNPFYKYQSKRPQAVPFRNYGKPTELEEQLDRLIAYIADGVHDSAAAVVRPELLRPEVAPQKYSDHK